MRDNDFKHLQTAEEDDNRVRQVFGRRRGRIGQNVASDNAVIEEVTCVNFMCHTRLHVQLSPLINFVVGMNGSGKSAVLTAITLCLGGKASATNRGTSLKNLIKGDEEQAILTVRLKNEGSDAYQPDLYGDSIIVERQFSKSGSSGYKLKNALGRMVSTKKGDVDDIIEYFNLQVDNPMNVLTQDAAKSFIQNSTPSTKYKFFVEGVQLQQLDNDYRLVSDTCDAIESKLDEAKEGIKGLKRKYDAATAKAEVIHQHQGMKETGRKLREQLAWIQVEEQEAKLVRREGRITAARESIMQAESTAELKAQAFQQVDTAMQNAQAFIQQLEEDLIPLTEEEKATKEVYDEASKKVQEAHTEQRQIKQNILAAQKTAADYNNSIEKENRRIEDANGGAHSRKLADVEDAKKDATRAKETLDRCEEEGPQLTEKLRSAQDELKKVEGPLETKRQEIRDCGSRLQDLRANRANVMDGYDKNMPRLLQTIRSDGGFREQPVGPMGLHIKLRKPMWSNLIEAVLGRNLNAFVVTCKADQMRLSSILRRFGMEFCPVLIGNHHPIDTTGHEPDPQYETILRVLEIDNDLIRRQLIIHNSIEQCLLIRKRTDAYRTMYEGPKPKNTKVGFSLHDSRRDFGHRLGYSGPNNDEDVGPVEYSRRKPRMRTDAESQISLQAETLSQLEREKTDLESRVNQLRLAIRKCETAVNTQKRNLLHQKALHQKAEDRVEMLESDLDRDNVEDGRLDALKGYLAEAENEVEMYKETYRNYVTEKDKLNAISAIKKRELDAIKLRVADHDFQVTKAKVKLRNKTSARSMVLSEKNAAIELIEQLRQELVGFEQERDAQAKVVETYITDATGVCQRVPVPEGTTRARLEAQWTKIQQQIRTYNRRIGGTDEEIMAAQEEALRQFQTATAHYDGLQELLGLLKLSFLKRMEQYWQFQRWISARSRIAFQYLLSERAFRGHLKIDHQAKKLDVHVEPDETTKSSKGRQTKTLSGGEKSFSSICLLLAIWEAMGAPLRCLDEYDVFMDDVNRDVSTKMIVSSFPGIYEASTNRN